MAWVNLEFEVLLVRGAEELPVVIGQRTASFEVRSGCRSAALKEILVLAFGQSVLLADLRDLLVDLLLRSQLQVAAGRQVCRLL